MLEEGLEPSRGLPPQGPEPCASTNSATRALPINYHGAEGNRTPDLLNAIQALSQLSYGPYQPSRFNQLQTGLTGLEPATSGVTDRHSNQLSYSPCFSLR